MNNVTGMQRLIILSFVLLFHCQDVLSQQYRLTHYSKDRGLPGNQVWDIFQDSKGYMWFSTTGALVKYNGREYRIFDEAKGLLGDFALNVQEDSKGNIWAGCPGGVSRITGDKIDKWQLGKFDNFFRVFVDSYNRVWIYNFQFANDLYVIENDSLMNYSQKFNFKGQRLLYINEDKNGAVHLLTRDGTIYRFFTNMMSEVSVGDFVKQVAPRMFFFDSRGDLILCGTHGVARVSLSKTKAHPDLEWILKESSTFGLESRNGEYWIATQNNGFFRIKPADVNNHNKDNILNITERNGLITNNLFTLFEDREENIWIGTNLKGVCKLSSMRFITFGKLEGFNEEAILSITPEGQSMYCLTENGIYRFNQNRFTKLRILDKTGGQLRGTRTYLSMQHIGKDRWILGGTPGLFLLESSGSISLLGLSQLLVQTFLRDSFGGIWIGTNRGIFKLNGSKIPIPVEFGISNRYINKILEIGKKDFYAATDSGLAIIENAIVPLEEKVYRTLTVHDGLLSNMINDIVLSPDSEIIIGTSEGINVYSHNSIYSITEGFHHRFVNVLFVDSHARVWAGTDDGLHLLQKINGKYRIVAVFFQKDGLMSNEFTRNGTIYEDENGRVWFGTYGGLTVYDSQEEHSMALKPLCYLSALAVNDSTQPIIKEMKYEFSHAQNKIRYFFEGLSFFDEDAVHFEYYLEPLERPWSNTTSAPSVLYNYLKPGSYIFHLRAVSPLGSMSLPQALSFNIISPFWDSPWFFTSVAIFLLFLGYLGNQYRLARIQKRNLLLEQIVEEKTAQLHVSNDKLQEQYRHLLEAQKELVEKAKLEKAYEEIQKLKNKLATENIYLREKQSIVHEVSSVIGKSEAIQQIRKKIVEVSKTDSTVLITGETGAGKNLIAEAIHTLSLRKERALITVNCAAIPEGLVESELFGHEKGAFTGANERRLGKFEIADGSTIFLDEIGDMNLSIQAKILNVLEERKFARVGGNQTHEVNVRVIAATNNNLEELIQSGKFRKDLYYRLNVISIEVVPLRERVEDIELLAKYFIDRYSKIMNEKIEAITGEALNILKKYTFPGNIRELENIIQRAVILCRGNVITDEHIILQRAPQRLAGKKHLLTPDALPTLEEAEKEYIMNVLEKTEWKIRGNNGAAEILGIHPNTLRSRMEKLKIPFRNEQK